MDGLPTYQALECVLEWETWISRKPIELLRIALADSKERVTAIREFQRLMYKSNDVIVSNEIDEILHELAGDLEFYVPIDLHRAQDSSYFGDRKAIKLIRETLRELESRDIK